MRKASSVRERKRRWWESMMMIIIRIRMEEWKGGDVNDDCTDLCCSKDRQSDGGRTG